MSKSSFICLTLVLLLAACQSGPDLCKCAELDSDVAVIGNLLAKQDPTNPQSAGLKNKYKLVQQCARKYDGYNNIKRRARKECSSFKSTELPVERSYPKINETVFFGRAKLRLKEFNYPLGDVEFTNFNSGTSWASGKLINTLPNGDKDTLKVEYSKGSIHTLIQANTYKERFNYDENYLKDRILEIIESSEGEITDNSFGISFVEVGNKVSIYGFLGGYDWVLKGKYFNPKFINIKRNLEYDWTIDESQLP